MDDYIEMSLEDDDFVIHGPEPAEPFRDTTVGQDIYEKLLDNLMSNDDAMVDAFTGRVISYKWILEKTCELAEALRSHGYNTDTVVSISSENNLEFFIPVIASLFVGCTMAPINHTYTHNEMLHNLNISKPKLIFCSKEVSPKMLHLKSILKFIQQIVVIDSNESISGAETLDAFIKKSLRGRIVSPKTFRPLVCNPGNLGAFIMSSSGTTGLPKGVLLSHRNIMTILLQSRDPRYSEAKNNTLGLLPFFHVFGLQISLAAITNCRKLVVFRRFNEDIFLRSIQNYKISLLLLAPPLAVFIAKSPKVLNYDLSCVQEVRCGAAPLSKNTELAIKKRLKNLKHMGQGYGLTESTLAVTTITRGNEKLGSCGKVVPFVSCKVRDPDTGKSLGPNKSGELCFKGPLIMIGYYNNEKATKETFTTDGWLRTGDLGYYDDEKYFFIVDRIKELIKYNGYQVAPAELEALLLNHPKVRDVGVAGLPDEVAGELPVAFIVKNEDQDATEAELQDYVNSMVSPHKRLRGGIIFVSEIPKNPSGKILRKELRERLKTYKKNNEIKTPA